MIKLLEIDPYLQSFEGDINLRMGHYQWKRGQLLTHCSSLADFANGSCYYGFHLVEDGWYYREWAPHADEVNLIGDFNDWNRSSHPLKRLDHGNWEIFLEGKDSLPHKSLVKVQINANGHFFDRIPLYITRTVQDAITAAYSGQIWCPDESFSWSDSNCTFLDAPPLIYECHIGMATEEYRIGTYREFTKDVLPQVKANGYNTIQLMAIMEHPYYASFGYQVSNFFAASSRYGMPEDLKHLIDTAHSMGIRVLLDLIHSHASANTFDGINEFDGTDYQFFHSGTKGDHSEWGTKLFDYSKPEVLHFLLSDLKFWMTEYHFDGFRFDGVTSMLYHDHGLGTCFDSYQQYFNLNTDIDAIAYLQLANELIHQIKPNGVTIAEDMSGMPGMCIPIEDGGIGFDYRLSMGIPDYFIKTLSSTSDEHWDMGKLWHELTTRRPQEKNIGYCESHDQALVGDKTIMFWLADQEMYWHMDKASNSHIIDRAMALHKMIRLVTFSLAGEGYLNFMGNEFGHPDWIDFPREGNNNSYQYARRQWSLKNNTDLRYQYLLAFDHAMLQLSADCPTFLTSSPFLYKLCNDQKLLLYKKGIYLFALNFHPTQSLNLSLPVDMDCHYYLHIDTNSLDFGGWTEYPNDEVHDINMPARTGMVFIDKK